MVWTLGFCFVGKTFRDVLEGLRVRPWFGLQDFVSWGKTNRDVLGGLRVRPWLNFKVLFRGGTPSGSSLKDLGSLVRTLGFCFLGEDL